MGGYPFRNSGAKPLWRQLMSGILSGRRFGKSGRWKTAVFVSAAMLAVIFSAVVVAGDGADGAVGEHFNYTNGATLEYVITKDDGGGCEAKVFTATDKTITSVTIPAIAKHNGKDYNVTAVGTWAFVYCEDLVEVYLPTGIIAIHERAFECPSLTYITIPDSVTSIGTTAFEGCVSLKHIVIPNSVTHFGDKVFWLCDALTSVTLPSGMKSITDGLFKGCTSLEHITIPSGVTSIGMFAFQDCTSLKTVKIPDGVTSIDRYAFFDCKSLTSVGIPDSLISIGEGAFCGCKSLTSVSIPESVNTIKDDAFHACTDTSFRITVADGNPVYKSHEGMLYTKDMTALIKGRNTASADIPAGVTHIRKNTFTMCSELTSVTIPASVSSIGSGAFAGCTSLKKADIPAGVKSIEATAFGGCTDPSFRITVADGNSEYASKDGMLYTKDMTILLNGRNISSFSVPQGVSTMVVGAFHGCNALKDVFIPKGVISIGFMGSMVFDGCTNTSFNITVEDGNPAFYSRDGMLFCRNGDILSAGVNRPVMTIPDCAKEIGYAAFMGFESMTSVRIPDSVTNIEWNSFKDCTSLVTVHIPSGVTNIGGSAFEGCKSLIAVTMSAGVKTIGENAFEGCTSLKTVAVSAGIESIEEDVFKDCKSVQTLTFLGNKMPKLKSKALAMGNRIVNVNASFDDPKVSKHYLSRDGNVTTLQFAKFQTQYKVTVGTGFEQPEGQHNVVARGDFTVTAVPEEGYVLKGIYVNGDRIPAGPGKTTFVIRCIASDTSVSAKFEKKAEPSGDSSALIIAAVAIAAIAAAGVAVWYFKFRKP